MMTTTEFIHPMVIEKHLKQLETTARALSAIKLGVDAENNKDEPNAHTIEGLLAGVGVLASVVDNNTRALRLHLNIE